MQGVALLQINIDTNISLAIAEENQESHEGLGMSSNTDWKHAMDMGKLHIHGTPVERKDNYSHLTEQFKGTRGCDNTSSSELQHNCKTV